MSEGRSQLSQMSDELVKLVDRVSHSVVAVEFEKGAGTGFVIAPDGYVLTNSHVVQTASKLSISFSSGDIAEGLVLGRDKKTDLAVVRVPGSGHSHISLVDDRRVQVGQLVVAIGNPFRFERSVSLGVVSAIDRTLAAGPQSLLEGLIQTDAAINPGNSGGPLLSTEGDVIGINTAIVPYGQGLGFAVPSYTAHWVAGELLRQGRVNRRYLGVGARSVDMPAKLHPELLRRRAIYVHNVEQGTPASDAGLAKGDFIMEADSRSLFTLDDLQRVLALGDPRELEFQVVRQGKLKKLWIKPKPFNDAA